MFKAISELFVGKRFEFDTPYTLHEVYDRLQLLSERDRVKLPFWKSKRRLLRVRMERIDKQSFQFKADRDEGRNLVVVAKGLVTQDISSVHVTGKVRLGWYTLVILTIHTIIWGTFGLTFLISIFSFSSAIEIKVCGFVFMFPALALSIFWWKLKTAQNQLYDQIHDTLEKSKRKNTESIELQRLKDRLKR